MFRSGKERRRRKGRKRGGGPGGRDNDSRREGGGENRRGRLTGGGGGEGDGRGRRRGSCFSNSSLDIPRERFSSMNTRVHGNKTFSSFGCNIFVGETNVAEEGVGDKTKTFDKGNQGDGVGARVDSSNKGEVVNFFLGGSTEFDLLLLHASVHVKSFTFETTSNLNTN